MDAVSGFWDNIEVRKAAQIGIMIGGLIILDSLIPGTGLLLAIAILVVMLFRSNAHQRIVDLLNWAKGLSYAPIDKKKPWTSGG